jgi:hypothetical protein
MRVKTNMSANQTLPPIQPCGCQADRRCTCPVVDALRKALDSLDQQQTKTTKRTAPGGRKKEYLS